MSIEDASLDNFVKDAARLLRPEAVKLDSVSTDLPFASDLAHRRPRTGTGVEHRTLRRQLEKPAKPPGFGRNEGKVTQF
jgi:hypothetical protein